nr:transporter substrate-binding domain-containing protein [Alteromonas ponticola]
MLSVFNAELFAREIEVAAGWDKPPYIITSGHSGFEVELTKSILNELGHEMVPIFVPMGRIPRMVGEESVGIGLTMNHRHKVSREILSEIYVAYQNVAVTLASRNVTINQPADLKNLTVIGFQTAKAILGVEYERAVMHHTGYLETPQQSRQVSMLLLGSVDVAVMDRNIFNYFKRQLPSNQQMPTNVHEIFPVTFYRAAIPDPELRKGFNRVLGEMISDGRYKALSEKFNVVDLLDRIDHPMEKKLPVIKADENEQTSQQ